MEFVGWNSIEFCPRHQSYNRADALDTIESVLGHVHCILGKRKGRGDSRKALKVKTDKETWLEMKCMKTSNVNDSCEMIKDNGGMKPNM